MIRTGSIALACAALLAACETDRSFDYSPPDRTYQAHGQTWTYSVVETNVRKRVLFSPSHGLFGIREGSKEAHYLTNAAGKTIPAHERIYTLQRDGRYRKTACCQHAREEAEVYAFDNRLVLVFSNAREFITDCFIHPNGAPNNEFEPDPGKRIFGSKVYAEFDPRDGTFKANTFDGGGTEADIQAATRRKGKHLSIAEHEYVMYSRRRPFLCDDPRALRVTPRPASRQATTNKSSVIPCPDMIRARDQLFFREKQTPRYARDDSDLMDVAVCANGNGREVPAVAVRKVSLTSFPARPTLPTGAAKAPLPA